MAEFFNPRVNVVFVDHQNHPEADSSNPYPVYKLLEKLAHLASESKLRQKESLESPASEKQTIQNAFAELESGEFVISSVEKQLDKTGGFTSVPLRDKSGNMLFNDKVTLLITDAHKAPIVTEGKKTIVFVEPAKIFLPNSADLASVEQVRASRRTGQTQIRGFVRRRYSEDKPESPAKKKRRFTM
jgi:hypothetical protein